MQLGFFVIDDKCEKPTGLGDPLMKVNKPIDFTMFGDIHCQAFPANDRPTGKNPKNAGRKPIPALAIVGIVFPERLYALSNGQTEFRIADRHSFQRFVGLDANKAAPDSAAVWNAGTSCRNLAVLIPCSGVSANSLANGDSWPTGEPSSVPRLSRCPGSETPGRKTGRSKGAGSPTASKGIAVKYPKRIWMPVGQKTQRR